jgi:predicted NBD/HSP70 family sugar kinase
VDAAAAGDAAAREALNRAGDWLGIGAVNLINLFNPGVLVFGGVLRDLYRAAAARIHARVDAGSLHVSRERVELRTAALGYDSCLAGAAELAFAPLLSDPLGVLERLDHPEHRSRGGRDGPREASRR